MSATVHVSQNAAITLDVVQSSHVRFEGVLLSIQGKHHGETMNCVLIPVNKVEAVIDAMRLAAQQVKPLPLRS